MLTKIDGEPTNTSYRKLLVEVYANAMSVLSNRGGGEHGHLGAIMSPKAYQEFAKRGSDPITDVTTVRRMLAVIEKTGQFELPIEKWRGHTEANYHTWAQFKIDFKKADTERKRKITAQTGRYAGANIAMTNTPPVHSANHTITALSGYSHCV